MNNEVYVVKVFSFDGEENVETLAICRNLKTAYNKIKEEIASRSYLQYFEQIKWHRVSDTTVVKSFEYESEFNDEEEYVDFVITRWEVM